MDAESFFARWSRRKTEAKQEAPKPAGAGDASPPAATSAAKSAATEALPEAPPTLQDVEKLTYSDDLSPFFAQQVDELIRRAAMKKLFADPHFNIMDGLDVYIEDYNKFEPLTPETVAELNHAQALLNPVFEPEHKLMELLELEPPKTQEAQAAAETDANAASNTPAEAAAHADAENPAATEQNANASPSPDTTPHDDKVQGL
jgi:hypothetical protein